MTKEKNNFIKLNINDLKIIDDEFIVHPAFTKKLPKNWELSDFSIEEKKVELKSELGTKMWFDFKDIFGIVISEAEDILLIYPYNDYSKKIKIKSVIGKEINKITFLKLVFDLQASDYVHVS